MLSYPVQRVTFCGDLFHPYMVFLSRFNPFNYPPTINPIKKRSSRAASRHVYHHQPQHVTPIHLHARLKALQSPNEPTRQTSQRPSNQSSLSTTRTANPQSPNPAPPLKPPNPPTTAKPPPSSQLHLSQSPPPPHRRGNERPHPPLLHPFRRWQTRPNRLTASPTRDRSPKERSDVEARGVRRVEGRAGEEGEGDPGCGSLVLADASEYFVGADDFVKCDHCFVLVVGVWVERGEEGKGGGRRGGEGEGRGRRRDE